MPRVVSPAEAVASLPSRVTLFLESGAGQPATLLEELLRQADRFEQIVLLTTPLGDPTPYADPVYGDRIRTVAFLLNRQLADACERGAVDYLPCPLSGLEALFQSGVLPPPDAALIQVAPPATGAAGYNLGVWVGELPGVLARARRVIAEVNRAFPPVPNGVTLPAGRLDLVCPVDHSLPVLPPPRIGPVEEQIARQVARLIPDGATLQVGIGSLAGAVVQAMADKRELGFHSGILTDDVLDLIRRGVITGAHKQVDRGLAVAALAMGSEELYRALEHEPRVAFRPYSYTHDPMTIGRIEAFWAVNQALQVDLVGQVNAEWLRGRQVGGVGGQRDFLLGARLSPGGGSIIALPSTADGGRTSRIVPRFEPGTPVTTSRSEVDWVVTEFGAVRLHGRTARERAAALASIAHPAFRADLLAQSKEGPDRA